MTFRGRELYEKTDHWRKKYDSFQTWIEGLKPSRTADLPWMITVKTYMSSGKCKLSALFEVVDSFVKTFAGFETIVEQILDRDDAPEILNSLFLYFSTLHVLIRARLLQEESEECDFLDSQHQISSTKESSLEFRCGLVSFLLGTFALPDHQEIVNISIEGLNSDLFLQLDEASGVAKLVDFLTSENTCEPAASQYLKYFNLPIAVQKSDNDSIASVEIHPYRNYIMFGEEFYFDSAVKDGVLCYCNAMKNHVFECFYNSRKKIWHFSLKVKNGENSVDEWTTVEGFSCRMNAISFDEYPSSDL